MPEISSKHSWKYLSANASLPWGGCWISLSDPYSSSCLKNMTHMDFPCWEKSLLLLLVYWGLPLFESVLTYSGTLYLDLADANISGSLSYLVFCFTTLRVAKWFPVENRTAPLNGLIAARELSDSLLAATPFVLEIEVTYLRKSRCISTGHRCSVLKELRHLFKAWISRYTVISLGN